MNYWAYTLNWNVRQFDADLCVMQVGKIHHVMRRNPHGKGWMSVLPLTDTWTESGIPVEWGVCPVIAKLQSMDAARRDFEAEILREKERQVKSKDKALDNAAESIAEVQHWAFGKLFKDVNTSLLPKYTKRQLQEKEKRHVYR